MIQLKTFVFEKANAIFRKSFRLTISGSIFTFTFSKRRYVRFTWSQWICLISLSRFLIYFFPGRPELLHNQVVYLGSDVAFSLTFYSSEASNLITWYRQWIRLINSTRQVQSTKPTTLNVLVRGKNVSMDGFRSSLVLRNVKEHNLFNIKICVRNDYGKSCHRYLESEGK